MSPETSASPRELAVLAEHVDTCSWLDMVQAAPPALREALGLATHQHRQLAMLRSRIPFSHFNMVLTLGCPAPADEAEFAEIDRFFGSGRHWIVVNENSQPADLGDRLLARGYAPDGAWERVLMRGALPQRWQPHAGGVEFVGEANRQAWSGFIRQCYGMPPPIGDWLHALVGRPGWLHAMRREGGRADGAVVMARSLFQGPDGWAWLGVDAPVPGVMAPCFNDDQKVTAALLLAAARAGAHTFVSDIEAPSPERRGPAYRAWGELGFEAVYLRHLFARGA